ncbi:MAG: DUF4232 domain-containing protein [Acidimicrobiales bacterium]|nr:DUF4232 domain-containing protein [Acidimicrobiales bacterium]
MVLGGIVALIVVGLTATAALLRRPEGPPDPVLAAVEQMAAVPGVRQVDILDYVPASSGWQGGHASARVGVVLDGELEPDAAGAAASAAVQSWYEARPFTGVDDGTELELRAGESTSAESGDVTTPVGVLIPGGDAHEPSAEPWDVARDDIAVAFALWKAGAVRASGHDAVAQDAERLVVLGQVAADREASVTLIILGGSGVYQRGGVPDVELVGLVAAASERPGVDTATFLSQESRLDVRATWPTGSAELGQLVAWLEGQVIAARRQRSIAFTLTGPGGVATAEGWVSGFSPPQWEPHPLPLPEGVVPWPEDPSAPSCGGDDLEVTWSGSDAAMGQRRGALRGRNVSGHPCAVEGVPSVEPLRGDGQPQVDVTTEPFRPGVIPARVVIPPGEAAVAAIDWRMMSARSELDYTTAVRVVSVPGAAPAEVVTDAQLDILDGAVLAVSPWAQEVD